MRLKSLLVVWVLFVFLLVFGCVQQPPTTTKSSTTETKITTSTQTTTTTAPGGAQEFCDYFGQKLPCSDELPKWGCSFREPSKSLDSLSPRYSLMKCSRLENASRTSEGVMQYNGTGLLAGRRFFIDYVAYRDGGFELIDSKDKFRTIFAPVEFREEALAFLAAFTGYEPVYEVDHLKNLTRGTYKVDMSEINLATVDETPTGYRITTLTEYGPCVDEIYKKIFSVTRSGDVKEVRSALIWESDRKPSCIS
ncbi:hypothetical protein HY991_04230 [Candidatus Micrarchaeota archaeon]|nr:hypothetical protein [Candidatus Micrarchaeota archaeon]